MILNQPQIPSPCTDFDLSWMVLKIAKYDFPQTQANSRAATHGKGGAGDSSDQLHPLQARMPVFADDDVVVHGDAERRRDVDDRLGHLDVRT